MMTLRQAGLAAALWAAFLCNGIAVAATVTAEGVAPLDAGRAAARELAIQDALDQAALKTGARIESSETLNQSRYAETGSLTASPLNGKVTIVNEYSAGGLYHVKVAVNTGDALNAPRQGNAASSCQPADGRVFRRRLVTTWFAVKDPADASDLSALSSGLPGVLAERLARSRSLSVLNAGGVGVLPDPRMADPHAGSDNVREIGARESAQFVVAGRVISTAVTSRFLRPTLFESNNTSQQGVYYSGPLSGILGGAVKYRPTERQFDMEVWLYDALSGAVLLNERMSVLARGNILPDNPVPFASAAFWSSDYGRAIDPLFERAATTLENTIACIPFSAKVVEVEPGGRSYINAGSLDGLKVGDKLLLYKPRGRAAGDQPGLGVPETLAGTVSIVQVQPGLAIGVSEGRAAESGDIVRYQPRR